MRALFARIRDAWRRREIDQAFDEEMKFHVEELERQALARGASPAEARAAARREFGNITRARESLREQAGFPSIDELVNDCRFAWRGILRRPVLSLALVAILALGLGGAATIYALIDSVFLRPLPVSHPEELVGVLSTEAGVLNRLSRGTARRLEASLPPNSVAAYAAATRCTVQIKGQPAVRANSRLVSGSFFGTLGLSASAGRLLTDADDHSGSPASVAIASWEWARTTYGSAEAAIGQPLIVNLTPVTIVGVLPRKFRDVVVGDHTELWFPTALQPRLKVYGNSSTSSGGDRPNDPDWSREERVSWLQLLLRDRPCGPSIAAALQRAWEPQRDDLARSQDDPREQERVHRRVWKLERAPGGQSRFRDAFHTTGWLLGGVVGVMLILVCTNVSGLLLVRSMSRHREIGVRLALGAGSFRVVRLGFIEALLLSLLGGAGACLIGTWLLPVAANLLAPGQDLATNLDWRAIGFMIALAVLTAVLSALAPALWISRVQPLRALSGNRGLGRAPVKLGRVLVVAQFAIAVTLVAVATALGRELEQSLSADQGFDREHVLTASFDASSAGYEEAKAMPLIEHLRAVVMSVPGVNAVGFSANGVLVGSQSSTNCYIRDPKAKVQRASFQQDSVVPGYFHAVGVPLLRGRELADTDTAKSQPVAVVSAEFARAVFGDIDPIGQHFGGDMQPSETDMVIVGVMADVHANGVRERPPAIFYTPQAQRPAQFRFIGVRCEGSVAAVRDRIRDELSRAEPALVFSTWKTLSARMDDDVSGEVATTRIASVFGAFAIILAGAGVAGSLGYLVVLRQRELALRMAIGAAPGHVLRRILVDSLRLGVLGGGLGLLLVWLVPQLPVVRSILYARPGLLPAFVATVVALLTAIVAGWFPARRAARIDPILLLKSE